MRREEGMGSGTPKVGAPKMARSDFPNCKFRCYPRWSLWSGAGRGGARGRGGPSSYGRRAFECTPDVGAVCGLRMAGQRHTSSFGFCPKRQNIDTPALGMWTTQCSGTGNAGECGRNGNGKGIALWCGAEFQWEGGGGGWGASQGKSHDRAFHVQTGQGGGGDTVRKRQIQWRKIVENCAKIAVP